MPKKRNARRRRARRAARRALTPRVVAKKKIGLIVDRERVDECLRRERELFSPVAIALLRASDPWRHERFSALLTALHQLAPRLCDDLYLPRLWRVAHLDWVRPLEAWSPPSKGSRRAIEDLVRHLVAKYPTPAFLLDTFARAEVRATPEGLRAVEDPTADILTDLAFRICRGESLFELSRDGLFPVRLTRRMCAAFLATPRELGAMGGLRRVQLLSANGDERTAERVAASFLARGFHDDESLVARFIEWIARNPEALGRDLTALWDFVRGNEVDLRRLTLAGLVDRANAWHRKARGFDGDDVSLPRSGFAGAAWTDFDSSVPTLWQVEEIGTRRGLAVEGTAQRHCVFTYLAAVESKRASIWSLRRADEGANPRRVLTIEVSNRDARIVQVRGKANRKAGIEAAAAVRRWASEANLTICPNAW